MVNLVAAFKRSQQIGALKREISNAEFRSFSFNKKDSGSLQDGIWDCSYTWEQQITGEATLPSGRLKIDEKSWNEYGKYDTQHSSQSVFIDTDGNQMILTPREALTLGDRLSKRSEDFTGWAPLADPF